MQDRLHRLARRAPAAGGLEHLVGHRPHLGHGVGVPRRRRRRGMKLSDISIRRPVFAGNDRLDFIALRGDTVLAVSRRLPD